MPESRDGLRGSLKDPLSTGELLFSHREQLLPQVLLPKRPKTEVEVGTPGPLGPCSPSTELLTRLRRHWHGYSF